MRQLRKGKRIGVEKQCEKKSSSRESGKGETETRAGGREKLGDGADVKNSRVEKKQRQEDIALGKRGTSGKFTGY